MDWIVIEGMDFYGYHGVLQQEQEMGQHFLVDLRLGLELRPAGESDDLEQTVNYSAVYRTVRSVVEGKPYRLIESVAEQIATLLLAEYEKIDRVWVRVNKPTAPIKAAVFTRVAVEVTRSRAGS